MLALNLLRVFHIVAQKKSVVKASKAMFISQPAVSNALKKLQKDLDIRLFRKTGRFLVLTEHGEALYEMTGRLFGVESEIEDFLAGIRATARKNIHIGLVTIYERFGIERVMRYFAEIDPSISVAIHSGNSRAVVEMLQSNSIDMGISGNVLIDANLHYKPYTKHEIFLVAPRGHRLYGRESFTAEDIHGERMVLKESGSSVRHTLDKFFAKFAVIPNAVVELSNLDSILSLTAQENCIAFLPDLFVSKKLSSDDAFSIARPAQEEIAFSTYVVWRKDGSYSEAVRRIVERFCELVDEKQHADAAE